MDETLEMVKVTDNRFPLAHSMSTIDLLTLAFETVYPIFCDNHFFLHNVLFLGRRPKLFTHKGFISFMKTSIAKATIVFGTINIIPINQINTSARFTVQPKDISHYFL